MLVSRNECNNAFSDALVCVITSNRFKGDCSVTLFDSDSEPGFLPEQSIVNRHKLFTIEQSEISKRFSLVEEQKFEEVTNAILSLLQTSR